MLRYRQVHDFWHVLSGLPPTVMGEIALKWLELGQTRLPMTMLSSVFGQLRLRADERQLMRSVYIPWAMRNARNARPLLCYRYEDNLTRCATWVVFDGRDELDSFKKIVDY
jgi:ubiquinone biosynthesis protein COQ4